MHTCRLRIISFYVTAQSVISNVFAVTYLGVSLTNALKLFLYVIVLCIFGYYRSYATSL